MTRISKLLAATDFSSAARNAVVRAARLAHATGAQLALLHVMSQRAFDELRKFLGAGTEPVAARLEEQASEELKGLAAELEARFGARADVQLARGTVLHEIAARADSMEADLLVVGGHGEGLMRQLLIGSTSERLLRRTSRPMLVVKQAPLDEYRRVLVPVDFSPWSGGALRLARVVAPHAELCMLHVYEVPFEGKLRFAGVDDERIDQYRVVAKDAALDRLRQLTVEAGLDFVTVRLIALQGYPARGVVDQGQAQDCDLIVLGKHGRNALEELLIGSVTKKVLAESDCDVLMSTRVEPHAQHSGPWAVG